MVYQIQPRNGTAAEWTAANPVLLEGELGVEIEVGANKFKIGDGSTPWNSLAYAGSGTGGGTLSIEAKTGSASITLPNDKLIECDATTGPLIISLPTAAGIAGTTVIIKKMDASANTVTADPVGAEVIDSYTSMIIEFQWTAIILTSDGTKWVMR